MGRICLCRVVKGGLCAKAPPSRKTTVHRIGFAVYVVAARALRILIFQRKVNSPRPVSPDRLPGLTNLSIFIINSDTRRHRLSHTLPHSLKCDVCLMRAYNERYVDVTNAYGYFCGPFACQRCVKFRSTTNEWFCLGVYEVRAKRPFQVYLDRWLSIVHRDVGCMTLVCMYVNMLWTGQLIWSCCTMVTVVINVHWSSQSFSQVNIGEVSSNFSVFVWRNFFKRKKLYVQTKVSGPGHYII